MSNAQDDVDRHMDAYFRRWRAMQKVVERTVMLRHPKSGYLHKAGYMQDSDLCDECGAGFSGISVSLAACGANQPGTPPREGQMRQWFHGCFGVVNLVDEPNPKGKRCKKCFEGSEISALADTESERR